MTHPPAPPVSLHRRSTTLLALLAPLLLLGTSAAVGWSWKDSLPDPVATHWGSDGADGFSSLAGATIVPLTVGAVVTVLLWALAWRLGHVPSTRRLANGMNTWLAVLLSTIVLGSLDAQRGLQDAADVGGIGGVVTLGLVVATAVGLAVARLTPAGVASPASGPVPVGARRLPLGVDERAVWFSRVHGGPGLTVGALGAAVVGVLAVSTTQWWMLLITAAVLALMVSMFSWTVRVDESGLTVRSSLGVPRTLVPLGEVVEARATTVRSFRDFGGWGWRTALDGRTGVVVRSGCALEVTRSTGGVFVVTVDDATTAAALINSLADRVRPGARVE